MGWMTTNEKEIPGGLEGGGRAGKSNSASGQEKKLKRLIQDPGIAKNFQRGWNTINEEDEIIKVSKDHDLTTS